MDEILKGEMICSLGCTIVVLFVILHFKSRGRAVVARRAHNPKVAGSSPALATKESTIRCFFYALLMS